LQTTNNNCITTTLEEEVKLRSTIYKSDLLHHVPRPFILRTIKNIRIA
jgi:hypothetical protein